MVRDSLYHKFLRVSAALLAVMLLFQMGILTGSRDLSVYTRNYVANVIGISASVETTELNEMTAELTRQKTDLDAREREIARREGETESQPLFDPSDFILSGTLLLLLFLIVLNYLFDFLRARTQMKNYAKVA